MKYIKGLYGALVLMMVVMLISTTILQDQYSGIAVFICLGLFLIGTAFFINAKHLKNEDL